MIKNASIVIDTMLGNNQSMTSQHHKPHDLGGNAEGTLDRSNKETTFWEQRIDAMVNLLRQKGVIEDWAQLRIGVEALSFEDYQRLDYYERWCASAMEIIVAKNILTREEISDRVQQLMTEK